MAAFLKKNRATQRLYGLLEVGTGPADLTGKTLVVYLAMPDESNAVEVAATIMPQTGGDVGRYYFDVTSANIAAVSANAAQLLIVANVWNADNSRFRSGAGLFAVKL
jgi:hypothetical protein